MRKAILAIFILLAAMLAPRQIVLLAGDWMAADHRRETPADTVFGAARAVAARYDGAGTVPGYYRLIPYATHRLIPEPFRIPAGAVEFFTLDGECDSAARALKFLLGRLGYEAQQINIATPVAAHSALAVETPDGRVYLDPYYGVGAQRDGVSDTVERLAADARTGKPVEDSLVSLRDRPKVDFYRDWTGRKVFMAPQGEDLGLSFDLPSTRGGAVTLGQADASPRDVLSASAKSGMGPYFTYLGNRYDRAWTRRLRATEAVRVEFVLVGPVREEVVHSAPPPEIEGNRVIWTLSPGEALILHDGEAPLHLFRPNFQYVDAIRVVPRRDPGGR